MGATLEQVGGYILQGSLRSREAEQREVETEVDGKGLVHVAAEAEEHDPWLVSWKLVVTFNPRAGEALAQQSGGRRATLPYLNLHVLLGSLVERTASHTPHEGGPSESLCLFNLIQKHLSGRTGLAKHLGTP